MKIIRHLNSAYPAGYRLLDVDVEQNIPSWYSSTLLLICAALLVIIASIKTQSNAPYKYHWVFLSIIFFGLSLDETISLHEELIEPLRAAFNLSGIFYFSWVLPAIAFLGILSFVYLKFFLNLSLRFRHLFLLAASVYLSGAIGVEMINGVLWEQANTATPMYDLFATLEEFLEMLGINIFIYALLSYLFENLGLKILFEKEKI